MQTIIRDGKKYKDLEQKSKISKKMIFYNENNDILIYENNISFSLPTVITNSEEDFISQLQYSTGLPFESDKINCFLQILNYYKHFECINNKLNKMYLKTIREYYTCMISMEKELETSIEPITKLGELFKPKIMNIDEILSIYSKKKHYSETEEALKEFKQKVLIR